MSMESIIKIMQTKCKENGTMNEAISWDQYFMGLAVLASKRSKDPRSQVGCAIINPLDNRVISVGYNGFPFGCSDEEFPWNKGDDLEYSDTKYAYVVHAEMNAILSAGKNLNGMSMYVTHSPCNECMKAIIQSGIKCVTYMTPYNPGSQSDIATMRMANAAGVSINKYVSKNKNINLGEL